MTVPESQAHLAPLVELAATPTTMNATDATVVQRSVVSTFFEFVMSAVAITSQCLQIGRGTLTVVYQKDCQRDNAPYMKSANGSRIWRPESQANEWR